MESWMASRREFLGRVAAMSAAVVAGHALGRPDVGLAQGPRPAGPTADQALQMLLEGNARYASGNLLGPHRGLDRRAEVAGGQAPFATILSCADSRVPPELVFDAGLGDLFVLRVAGNVLNDELLGSIEFSVGVLGAPLVMVLGHTRCGAVAAAVEAVTQGTGFPGHVESIARAIDPAVERVRNQPGDPLDNAIRENVALVTAQVATAPPVMAGLVSRGEVKVVGAYYSLDSGRVTISA
jgi:carbonic anhydrase